jgi:hypothetical protein
MIECERRRVKRRVPVSFRGVVAGSDLLVTADNAGKCHTDCVATGIASRVSKCGNLFEANSLYTSFLLEFPRGGMLERLVLVDEAPWQGPLPLIRIIRPLYQEHLDFIAGLPEQYNVSSDRGTRVFVAVVGLSVASFFGHSWHGPVILHRLASITLYGMQAAGTLALCVRL